VAETEFADDESGPPSSAVTNLFAAQKFPIEHIGGADVSAGVDWIVAYFGAAIERHDQPPIVICDARTESHLATIAAAGARFEAMFVGSGGLATHVRVNAPTDSAREVPQPGPAPGTPLAVVRSVSDTTLEQLGHVPDIQSFHLDPLELLEGTTDAAADVADRLDRGVPTVLTAAPDRATVEDTIAAGRVRELSDAEIGNQIATGLGGVAAEA